MRAVASNPESGRLVGIPTGVVLAASWGIAGALGALAGTLFAAGQGQVTPILMFYVFVVASAAATLGGLDSPLGAVVAGLLIGIIENMAATFAPGWVGQEMKLAVALVVHLRRAVGAPVGPVRLDQGGAGLVSAFPLRIEHGSPPHWVIRALWAAGHGRLRALHPDQDRDEHDPRHDAGVPAGGGGVVAQPRDGLRRDRVARPLGLLRTRRLHLGRLDRQVRLEPGLDRLRVGAARLRRRLRGVAAGAAPARRLPRPRHARRRRAVPDVDRVAEAGVAHPGCSRHQQHRLQGHPATGRCSPSCARTPTTGRCSCTG